jgi:hypothetical protein
VVLQQLLLGVVVLLLLLLGVVVVTAAATVLRACVCACVPRCQHACVRIACVLRTVRDHTPHGLRRYPTCVATTDAQPPACISYSRRRHAPSPAPSPTPAPRRQAGTSGRVYLSTSLSSSSEKLPEVIASRVTPTLPKRAKAQP